MPEIDDLVEQFVYAVWCIGQQEGWPVNAYLIGPTVFKGDDAANWKTIRAVLGECRKRELLVLAGGGDIQRLSDIGLREVLPP